MQGWHYVWAVFWHYICIGIKVLGVREGVKRGMAARMVFGVALLLGSGLAAVCFGLNGMRVCGAF